MANNLNQDKVLGFLGIARRASKIISGQDIILDAIKKGKVKFLFIASDSGSATFKKFHDKANYYQVPVNNGYTKEKLSDAIGMKRTLVGISDLGMANKFINLTKENKGE